MQIWLPPVFAVEERIKGVGELRQLAQPEQWIDAHVVAFTSGRNRGHRLDDSDGNALVYHFPKKLSDPAPSDAPVLVGTHDLSTPGPHDLRHTRWVRHPRISQEMPQVRIDRIRRSWEGAFRYVEEIQGAGAVSGMRRPQLGALHAIHAHWSVSSEIATVVMPTGTGKTETMLCTLVSAACERVLVVVPTDALRTQIAAKFESLGILSAIGARVLHPRAERPVVGTLTSRPTTTTDVDAFFSQCNIVVTTSHLIGGCTLEIQQQIEHHCSHLFIDEAHHAEAKTWRAFRALFEDKRTLQFTATPFREDGQRIDGKMIYIYPLKKAQNEGYFRPIRFRRVYEFGAARGDEEIASAALDELDRDVTGKHIVMARVGTIERAETVLEIYRSLGRYNPIAIHSKMKVAEREVAREALFGGSSRIVVCVDMLGEGFDLPELKIAAFHDIRKSLAVTLQLAGRFTRARPDLGDAVFIANTALADVREELQTLYAQDPDWNALLPALASGAIDGEVASQQFFDGFARTLDEVPLNELHPSASMVVYKTNCVLWTPDKARQSFRGLTSRDQLFTSLNVKEQTLVIVAALEQGVAWSTSQAIRQSVWDLLIVVWDSDRDLLYIHGSANSGSYLLLAKAVCGDDVSLIADPEVFRCFYGLRRLVLTNVGLNEHLGRQLRFTGRMGSDVESRIGTAVRRVSSRAVIAGQGFEGGRAATAGASKRGRIWSTQRLRVDSFVRWAKTVGAKLVDDTIDPNKVLEGTLKPESVDKVPTGVAITAEWPLGMLRDGEAAVRFLPQGYAEATATTVDIEVAPRDDDGPIVFRVFSESWGTLVRLELVKQDENFDFKFVDVGGCALELRRGPVPESLAEFFTNHPPVVWFADGSSLEGCRYTALGSADLLPYPIERLREIDWTSVDIRAESQGEAKKAGTIQHRIIQILQGDPNYAVILDDDGANEAADVVAISVVQLEARERIDVEFYHLKFAGQGKGGRVDDLYEVCGQAQRSVSWRETHQRTTELFLHLLRRDALRVDSGKSTRFERGSRVELGQIRDLSRRVEVQFKVFIVQPGLSKAVATESQMRLLAVTERYLADTYQVPLHVICRP